MQTSTDRVRITHTGSLPRPKALLELLEAKADGRCCDGEILLTRVREAVREVVGRQVAAGIDTVSDGEMGKTGFSVYVRDHLGGFDGESSTELAPMDLFDYPGFGKRSLDDPSLRYVNVPACTGPVTMANLEAVRQEIANLQAALDGASTADAFLACASPGVVSLYFKNQHYPNHESYVFALADAMRTEYEEIAAAGLIVQLDCPDLAMGRHTQFAATSLDEFKALATLHVEALNHAVARIPEDQLRLHICWGNYEGPHHRDVALADILPIVLRSRPQALVLESCNPRHAHEWKLFEDVRLPDDKLLVPGVIDTTTNYIEHPELVAERIVRFASVVGRERVIAGTDCGFGTFAGQARVHPKIAWAKLDTLVEGARIASERLF
jgi:5-methyltetrahydropteroyltriglutamate--homocysteine methyltransferase